jgi:hypothetical protein
MTEGNRKATVDRIDTVDSDRARLLHVITDAVQWADRGDRG